MPKIAQNQQRLIPLPVGIDLGDGGAEANTHLNTTEPHFTRTQVDSPPCRDICIKKKGETQKNEEGVEV